MGNALDPSAADIPMYQNRIIELEQRLADAQATIQALNASQESSSLRRFELLYAHSRDIILFIRRSDGLIQDANDAAVQAYGYSHAQLLGLTIRNLRAPDSLDLTADQMARADDGGILFETEHRRQDGSIFPVEVSSQGATIGGERTLISVIRDITERNQAEAERARLIAALQQEKIEAQQHAEELHAVIEAMHDPVMVYDRDGMIYRANKSAIRVHGFDPSHQNRLATNRTLVVRHPNGQILSQQDFPSDRALRGQAVIEERLELTNTQGHHLTLLVTATPLVVNGVQVGAVSVWRDVTEQKQIDQALQTALARAEEGRLMLETILENVPIGLMITGGPPDFPIARASKYGLDMNQRPVEDLVGLPAGFHQASWRLFLPDGVTEPLPEHMPLYRASRLGEINFHQEMVMEAQDGRKIPVLISGAPVRNTHGEIVAAINAWLDVTEIKKAELALRESEQRYSALFNAPTNGVAHIRILTDEAGRPFDFVVLQINHGYETILGIRKADIEGKQVTEVFPGIESDPVDYIGKYGQVAFEGGDLTFEAYFSYTQQWLAMYVYSPKQGEVITIFTDISERKRAEEALAESAKKLERSNWELEQFAFVASHDLQEPLRKIEAFGELLLKRSIHLDERERDYMERMRNAATRMRAMVDGLLQLSRVNTQGQPFERVDLSQLTDEVLSDLYYQVQRTGGRVEVDVLPAVDGDPLQFRLLMQNLIGNALKFHIPETPPVVRVSGKTLANSVQILVEDNGIGFEVEEIDQIFQPFKRLVGRSDYEGSGMGLAICRRIVERHGGEITAQSSPGKGTTFIVTLPMQP